MNHWKGRQRPYLFAYNVLALGTTPIMTYQHDGSTARVPRFTSIKFQLFDRTVHAILNHGDILLYYDHEVANKIKEVRKVGTSLLQL